MNSIEFRSPNLEKQSLFGNRWNWDLDKADNIITHQGNLSVGWLLAEHFVTLRQWIGFLTELPRSVNYCAVYHLNCLPYHYPSLALRENKVIADILSRHPVITNVCSQSSSEVHNLLLWFCCNLSRYVWYDDPAFTHSPGSRHNIHWTKDLPASVSHTHDGNVVRTVCFMTWYSGKHLLPTFLPWHSVVTWLALVCTSQCWCLHTSDTIKWVFVWSFFAWDEIIFVCLQVANCQVSAAGVNRLLETFWWAPARAATTGCHRPDNVIRCPLTLLRWHSSS